MLLSLIAAASIALPADSTRWIVTNHGREAGELVVVTSKDSTIARYVFTDRNRGARVETRYRLGADGRPVAAERRAILPDGKAGEPLDAFMVAADSVRVGVTGMVGGLPARTFARERDAIVALRGGTPWEEAELARQLLARPGRAARILGGGDVRAEIIVDTVLRAARARESGRTPRAIRARLVAIYRGTNPNPSAYWLDERGGLLSTDVAWFITSRPDVVPLLPAFRTLELRWRNRLGEEVGRKAVTPTNGTLALRNGDLFDSEAGVMVPGQTVVVRGDRIVAVGPAATTEIPAGATIIDATGRTIMPGLWEMHTHVQVASQSVFGLVQLANGLTTARDLAADTDVAVSQRDRERKGLLASPRLILAGFMEGPLKWAGPSDVLVSTEREARAWVARYDSLGYRQIKVYNVTHPDLIPTIAEEAHKRGMLLSGHIPRGMTMQAAVALGFDEVQHAAFFFSNFFQDSLYVPTMRAYSQVATVVAPTIDVSSREMGALIDYLKSKGTVVDGTFNLWIGGGGASVGAGQSSAQARADSAYMALIRRLHAAGIPLVAGTDNSAGTTYLRELQMYATAGIPLAKVLQIATIDAARFMREDNDNGSVRVGKVADLLVVDGRPMQQLADLSRVRTVVRGGRLYDVATLRKLVGMAGGNGMAGADGWEGEPLEAVPIHLRPVHFHEHR